jgi:hypothetical protein
MPKPIKRRIKLALTLAPALFVLAIWQMVLSPQPYVGGVGLVPAVGLAAAVSFAASYFVALFFSTLRGEP